jgi:putative ABC transport system substrate-binding protein
MKKIIVTVLAILAYISPLWAAPAETNILPKKKVLISQVVDHPALNMTVQGIIAGLADNGFQTNYNLEVRVESAQANPAIAAQIANKFVNQNPDVVVGVGTIAAQSFIKYAANKQVKLVFSSVTDPNAASLYTNNNLSGVSNFVDLAPQLQLFKQLQPNLKRLGVIYNPGEINSLSVIKKLEKACADFNITLIQQIAAKTSDVAQSAAKLVGMVDAIFITNDNTALSSLQSIIKVAQQHKIPVYVSDTDSVALGAVAALGPSQRDVGYQTGVMIAKILNGVDLHKIPIEYPNKTELFVNLPAAAKANIVIPKSVLEKATTIIRTTEQ